MELITTHTNHNHEELLENIDAYRGSWGKLHTGGKKNSADYLLVCGVVVIFVML